MASGRQAFLIQKQFYGDAETHQSDNGSEFQTDFVNAVLTTGSKHRYSRPYKKNEQSHIESFNRSLRSECFTGSDYGKETIVELQKRADNYCAWFINERWHMGLPNTMTPRQFIEFYSYDPDGATMALVILHDRRNGGVKSRICG